MSEQIPRGGAGSYNVPMTPPATVGSSTPSQQQQQQQPQQQQQQQRGAAFVNFDDENLYRLILKDEPIPAAHPSMQRPAIALPSSCVHGGGFVVKSPQPTSRPSAPSLNVRMFGGAGSAVQNGHAGLDVGGVDTAPSPLQLLPAGEPVEARVVAPAWPDAAATAAVTSSSSSLPDPFATSSASRRPTRCIHELPAALRSAVATSSNGNSVSMDLGGDDSVVSSDHNEGEYALRFLSSASHPARCARAHTGVAGVDLENAAAIATRMQGGHDVSSSAPQTIRSMPSVLASVQPAALENHFGSVRGASSILQGSIVTSSATTPPACRRRRTGSLPILPQSAGRVAGSKRRSLTGLPALEDPYAAGALSASVGPSRSPKHRRCILPLASSRPGSEAVARVPQAQKARIGPPSRAIPPTRSQAPMPAALQAASAAPRQVGVEAAVADATAAIVQAVAGAGGGNQAAGVAFRLAAGALTAAANATAVGRVDSGSAVAALPMNNLATGVGNRLTQFVVPGDSLDSNECCQPGRTCKFIHAVNYPVLTRNFDDRIERCPAFEQPSGCSDPRCGLAHDINPSSSRRQTVRCRRFTRKFRALADQAYVLLSVRPCPAFVRASSCELQGTCLLVHDSNHATRFHDRLCVRFLQRKCYDRSCMFVHNVNTLIAWAPPHLAQTILHS